MTTEIIYGDYRIYPADCGPTQYRYGYAHKDYDGEGDSRHGYTRTVDEAKAEIDEREGD